MDLRQIVRTVRAHWIVAAVTFIVCVGAGLAFAVLPAKQYQATVVLLAQPPASSADPGSDVTAIQIEIPQIVVEADNPIITDQARQRVPDRFRPDSVKIAGHRGPCLELGDHHRHEPVPGGGPGLRQRRGHRSPQRDEP